MALLQSKFCLGISSSIKAARTPTSQDTNPSTTTSEQTGSLPTKIILSKKKSEKWSTGAAPGEYGGPSLTSKIRKYWGGEKDPLTSKDDFIWNKDFMGRMKRLIEEKPKTVASSSKEEPSDFLSLTRAMKLDRLPAMVLPDGGSCQHIVNKRNGIERIRLQLEAVFGARLLGSLVYIRMLSKSVDSMGGGAKGLLKGAIAQPRLFVPVVFVMIYNRWNGILVPEQGFIPPLI